MKPIKKNTHTKIVLLDVGDRMKEIENLRRTIEIQF